MDSEKGDDDLNLLDLRMGIFKVILIYTSNLVVF